MMDELIIQRADEDTFCIKYTSKIITGELHIDRASIVRMLDECIDGLMRQSMKLTVSPKYIVLDVGEDV